MSKKFHKRARALMFNEVFDHILFSAFLKRAKDEDLQRILREMIEEEKRHIEVWRSYTSIDGKVHLPVFLRMKLWILLFTAIIFRDRGIRVMVESLEVNGIRHYIDLADELKGTEYEEPLNKILRDELEHEAAIVKGTYVEGVTGDRVRNFLLGFNDGLVELLGAIVGFYATLSSPNLIVLAGISVISAGSFSMAAGAYNAGYAEREINTLHENKERFLSRKKLISFHGPTIHSFYSALIVGGAFIIGGMLPLTPVILGHSNFVSSLISAGIGITIISIVLAFVSGISIRKRLILNLSLVFTAAMFAVVVGTIVEIFTGA